MRARSFQSCLSCLSLALSVSQKVQGPKAPDQQVHLSTPAKTLLNGPLHHNFIKCSCSDFWYFFRGETIVGHLRTRNCGISHIPCVEVTNNCFPTRKVAKLAKTNIRAHLYSQSLRLSQMCMISFYYLFFRTFRTTSSFHRPPFSGPSPASVAGLS